MVLIVDDEPGMRDMLSWSLRDSGYGVKTASNGAEAVELMRATPVDLVITDLTMPRLGGFGLLAAAAASPLKTPVIVVTGFGTVEMAVHAMKLGAADFLLKPFDLGRLLARVHESLESVTPPPYPR